MRTIEGNYFDGRHPIAKPATMVFMESGVQFSAGSISTRFETNHLVVSPRIGSTCRFVSLPDGGQFGCADDVFLDSLPQESQAEGIAAWLEERWIVALACVAVISIMLVIGYFFGLPAAAERIALRIPMETESAIGNESLTFLDEKGWLKPTDLSFDQQAKIRDNFSVLCRGLPFQEYYVLEFRRGGIFGANALALPGGIIIITDEMVEASKDMEEVMAVLAHEIGHVEHRHAMRSVLQSSAIGVVVATLTSDAATLSAAITSLPVLLAQTKYSRDFETAADDFAFKLLKQNGYSPMAFASLMERLAKENGHQLQTPEWISTHPVSSKRVARARNAATE